MSSTDYNVEFEQRPGYLFARVTGENSPETIKAYTADILQTCQEHGCFRVLIHECLDGPRLSATEIYQMFAQTMPQWRGKFDAVAIVDEKMGEMAKFAETVGVNRGMPIAAFASLEEATRWISALTDGGSP